MRKYTYDTEKEAQESLDQARNEWKYFCPAIRAICRKDCISYHAGSIYGKTPTWKIFYPCCSNVLITGEINVNRE